MANPLSFHDLRPDAKKRLEEIATNRHPIALLLDEVTDPRNAGALFRLADAGRCQAIYGYKTGDLPTVPKVQKVGRSCHKYVPFLPLEKLAEVAALQNQFTLVGLDFTDTSIPYTEYQPQGPTLLMIGNETRGLRPELLALANACIHIPMYGMNSSMNVAVASGIVVYGLLGKVLIR